MRCPNCGCELDDEGYCSSCFEYFRDFDDFDYDSMVNDGSQICLNCTYWSVNPHGSAYGMICRRGYPTDGPGDSCSDFVRERQFGNYGDGGEMQFDDTGRAISNKLYHWRNGR